MRHTTREGEEMMGHDIEQHVSPVLVQASLMLALFDVLLSIELVEGGGGLLLLNESGLMQQQGEGSEVHLGVCSDVGFHGLSSAFLGS